MTRIFSGIIFQCKNSIKLELGEVVHAHSSSTRKAEAGKWGVLGQSGLHIESISLKIKH